MARMYVGLFYITGEDTRYMSENSLIHYPFILAIFFPTFIFIVKWLAVIKTQFLIIMFLKNRGLFKLFTLNMYNEVDFEREHIQNRPNETVDQTNTLDKENTQGPEPDVSVFS